MMEYDYYEGRPEIPEEEHLRRVQHQVRMRYDLRTTNDPFAMSRTEFQRLYRMPQHMLIDLVGIIRPYIPENRGSSYVPIEIKVLCAIGFYAQGSYQRPHGRIVDLNLSQASVSNCLRDVTIALNNRDILLRYIRFPLTREEREEVIQRNLVHGFPGVVGYVDGTLVKIVTPPGPDKHIFRTRKGYCGLNVQIVCDAHLNLLNVNATFPGSANDPYIYRRSHLRGIMRQAYEENPCWLLGDSIYPLEPWMQTPIIHAQPGTPEYRFTKLHCQGRNCVERCIGVMKARWRCLLTERALHYEPVKAGKIVNACAVLHNYLRRENAPDPQPVHEDLGVRLPDGEDDDNENLRTANQVRAFLIGVAQQRHNMLHQDD